MKQTMLALLIAFFSQLLIISNGISTSQFFLQQINSENKYLTKEEHWFNQTLDHFSPYDHRTFGQRYYEFLDHFRIPDGPIFLKICGESACSGIPNDYLSTYMFDKAVCHENSSVGVFDAEQALEQQHTQCSSTRWGLGRVLAKKFGAAVVSLEHRYYGKSTPFKSLATGNLKYLSSKQALFDLAAFRNFYQDSLNVKLNRSNIENPWFVFGTSYSGALSAWFRLKFPHLTCGSLASSAVVQAVYSFSEFDKQARCPFLDMVSEPIPISGYLYVIYAPVGRPKVYFVNNNNNIISEVPQVESGEGGIYTNLTPTFVRYRGCVRTNKLTRIFFQKLMVGESAGPECKTTLQEITKLVEARLASNPKDVKSLFGADELRNDGDFLYFVADAAVTAFQYGSPDKLCIPLLEAKKSGADLVNAYATYVKDYYVKTFGVSVKTYDQENLKNTVVNGDTSNRLWWFQVCTEVAYFQVAPMNDSIRSSKVDTRHVSYSWKYHLDLCRNVFGAGIYPDVDATNLYYGGTKIAGSKIVFTNGSQDPWRHASKQTSSPELPSYIISCHNCGHGTDMRGCPQSPLVPEGDAKNCSSPDAVRKVREKIVEHIDLWLSQCQVSGRSSM
ncbi:hypothetical protein MTR67_011470 [Solanum verrucosum]|uniref:Serine carboxypeptidase S28 family protein n=1 Tax=Solanum verrucosum TaxID=315347 RepID=A0AAF0TM10_SOLVR|nr:hypothetical protein MTR67_011470 [Solanum verrucosum]